MCCEILHVFISEWLYSSFLLCKLLISVFWDGGDFLAFFLPFCFFRSHLNTVFLWCLFHSLFATRGIIHLRFMPLFEKCLYSIFWGKNKASGWCWRHLKNFFKSPLCLCEQCSATKHTDLLPQCQTHLVSVLPALPYVHMEKRFPTNFVAGFTAASPIMILLYLVTSRCC